MSTQPCPRCGTPNRGTARYCLQCGIDLHGPAFVYVPLQPGQILKSGTYRVLRPLGKGGMGAVYLATQTLAGKERRCVIKEMLDYVDPAEFPDARAYQQAIGKAQQRFQEEAATLVELNHAGIPQIYDYFSEGGRNYIAMQFIEGESLDRRLSREDEQGRWVKGAAQPVEQVVRWGIQLCHVLEYLAGRQPPVIHHDIKPANIILNKATDEVRLVDFGTARARLTVHSAGQVGMRKSSIYGTAGYAAPEMYPPRCESEARSDVYALGATLYHLLTDDDPRDHPMQFPRLSSLPASIRKVLEGALELDVQQRLTATQMRQMLEAMEIKAAPFHFRSGVVAHNMAELVELCDQHWDEARFHFYRQDFEDWLRRSLHRTDLESKAAAIRQSHSDQNEGLEAFLHLLDPDLPAPEPAVDPAVLSFGYIKADKSASRSLRIRNACSRGHLSGKVIVAPQVEWLRIRAASFSGNDVSMEVEVDTSGQAQGARLATTLQVETPYAPAVNVPVKARVALAWVAFVGTLLLYILIGGLLSWGASLLVGQIALSGLNDDLWMYLMGLGVLVTLCGGLAAGKALAEPGGFAGLGFMLGMGLGLPGFAYLFLAMLAEFQSLRSAGGDALAYGGTFGVGALVALLLGLFGSLRKVRRKVLAVVVPLLLMGVLAAWIARDPSVTLMQTTYTVMGREIPVFYVSAVRASQPVPAPVVLDDLLPVPIEPTATPSPTPRPTATPTPVPHVALEGEGIRVGSKVRVIKTRGDKLRIRAEAGIKAKILTGATEGSILEVIGGPKTADGYTWWQVKLDSTVGWAAQDWLEPVK